MSPNSLSVDQATTVSDAIDLMIQNESGAVVVTRAGDPIGIFTERDVLRRVALKEIDPWQITMNEVMTSPVITMPKTAVWEKC